MKNKEGWMKKRDRKDVWYSGEDNHRTRGERKKKRWVDRDGQLIKEEGRIGMGNPNHFLHFSSLFRFSSEGF